MAPRRIRRRRSAGIQPAHLDEGVLGALAGEHVAGHLTAHAAREVGDVDDFLHLPAAFAGDFAHFH